MFPYTPKPLHAMLSAFVVIVLLALKGNPKLNDQTQTSLTVGALIFSVITAVILLLLILDARVRMIQVMTDWMTAFARLDDEGRAAVAWEFPSIRYRMKHGEVREFFEDTNVPIETFRLFLQTSNDRYISPRRDWCTREQPEWAWLEIYEYLCNKNYIFPDSAAGNISHQWKGESYRHLMAYWLAGRQIANMSEMAYQE